MGMLLYIKKTGIEAATEFTEYLEDQRCVPDLDHNGGLDSDVESDNGSESCVWQP